MIVKVWTMIALGMFVRIMVSGLSALWSKLQGRPKNLATSGMSDRSLATRVKDGPTDEDFV